MSSIGYRDWEIWINKTLLDDLGDARGVYLIKVEPLLMAKQTVQFIYEKIEDIRHHREAILNNQAKDYFSLFHWTPQELVLQKVAELSSHDNIQDKIAEILHELDALSLCLDFPLSCNYIEFSYHLHNRLPEKSSLLQGVIFLGEYLLKLRKGVWLSKKYSKTMIFFLALLVT